MAIPKTIFWMERREYYRVKIPVSKPSYCQFILKDRDPFNIKIHDLSLSGFSVLDQYTEFFDQMVSGATFEQCKLILFEAGEYTVSFAIRYDQMINPDRLQKIKKNGCKFLMLTRVAEDAIQGYMQQIQREDLQDSTMIQDRILIHKKIIIYLNDR